MSGTAGPRRGLLHWAPLLTLLALIGPVAAGLAGTLLPAFGYLPALSGDRLTLEPFRDLLGWPGFAGSVWLSFSVGLVSAALSLAMVTLVCAAWQGSRAFTFIESVLSPLLSVPHAAAAFGLAFLIAPSGWIARLFSPWLTGWERPPDWLIVQDPNGLSLIAGLVAKEVPFLLLMSIAALPQCEPRRGPMVAQALGHGHVSAWLKTVFPRLYPQIRLPVYAVIAFSASVVDVSLILGPSTPPPLAVQVVRWMSDPDLTMRFRAAAGAVVQLGIVIAAICTWRVGEFVIAMLGWLWVESGGRGRHEGWLRALGLASALYSAGAVLLGLAGLAVWSFAGLWTFPSVFPEGLGLKTWARHGPAVLETTGPTMLIAATATTVALVLTIACLEAEHRRGIRPGAGALWMLYLPLLLPQVAFLMGLQLLALTSGLDGSLAGVIIAHTVFVLPYVFLSLSDPYRAWDGRHALVGAALGAAPGRVFSRVRLPMMLRPVLVAGAVGFAVSVGQYLPTLLIGGGRVRTLTTEAVALAAGGDRRLIGAYAIAQTATVFLGFALAIALPRIAWRNRRALQAG